jgi:hypothetical protein
MLDKIQTCDNGEMGRAGHEAPRHHPYKGKRGHRVITAWPHGENAWNKGGLSLTMSLWVLSCRNR